MYAKRCTSERVAAFFSLLADMYTLNDNAIAFQTLYCTEKRVRASQVPAYFITITAKLDTDLYKSHFWISSIRFHQSLCLSLTRYQVIVSDML